MLILVIRNPSHFLVDFSNLSDYIFINHFSLEYARVLTGYSYAYAKKSRTI